MKKTLLALAVLAAAGTASAQSSVTIFGVIDANARWLKNGDTDVKQLGTDGLSSSRLGFRGVEDLGGGLKAGFWLESALNADTGSINSSGKFWHRRSTVSLEGGFGEVRLGRDYSPTYTAISDFDAFGDVGVGKFSNIQSGALGATAVNTNSRIDNAVQYFLPSNLGGVYGNVAVAAGEGTVGNKYVGGRAGYKAGPLNIGAGYGQTDANVAEDRYKVATVGASYDFGVLRLLGSVSQFKFLSNKERLYLIGAHVPVGSGVIRASVGRADLSDGTAARLRDADDATLTAIGYTHNLSKRTALYGTYSRIANKGVQTFNLGATTPAIPAGGKSQGVELGLRHSF